MKLTDFNESDFGHNGGDFYLLNSFSELLVNQDFSEPLTSTEDSLESHIMAFAAEESRVTGKSIDMTEYRKNMFI